ncbi:MAG TPA: peptidylprolyl isomerase [Gemmatimonadales bacterium]|nr:peptidylprolyl isomerase [Gemmatimonadales bacterium]
MPPRFLPVLALLLLGACGGEMDPAQARAATVASAGGATLDGATLENWLLAAPIEPSEASAAILLSTWVDGALLSSALRANDSLADSALVAEAVRPDAVRGTILDHFTVRARAMPPVSDASADSAARLGEVRVFQHILLRVAPDADSVTVQRIVAQARALETRVQEGANFAALAREVSQDTVSGPGGGYLPPLTRGDLPQGRFGQVAWALAAGEASGLVGSPAGIHLLRRAGVEESRPGVKAWLAPRFARRADSLWIDSLSTAKQLQLADGAQERVRQIAREPLVADSAGPLATWTGGSLTPEAARTWIGMLPPLDRSRLVGAPDSAATLFLREIAQREMVLGQVSGGQDALSPRAWGALAPQFAAAIGAIVTAYRPVLTDGDPSAAAKAFVTRVTDGTLQYRPLPGALATVLRSRTAVTVDHDVVRGLVAAALPVWRERRAAADSARADSGTVAPTDSSR